MRKGRRETATFLLGLLLVAGCVGLGGDTLTASATGGFATSGTYDYEAKNVHSIDGRIAVSLSNTANSGLVEVNVTDSGANFLVIFDRFTESRPFHDGGVAFNIHEHGASGVGDTLVPEILVRAAAWGDARVYRNGLPFRDPHSNKTTWKAHVMAATERIHVDETHKVYNAARAGPYDPASPADGLVEPGNEIHFVWYSNDAAPPAAKFFRYYFFPDPTYSA
ncbi:MAG: hypothetical protein HY556_02260 [Euryarchaeota archaeon]|nr:hypothetical protein [Euryarchaeota archaeon]